jgi:hypothetical protein
MDITKVYHANGNLRSEVTLVDGLPHGVTRHWHANGVLAKEIPLHHGVIDGTVIQWNERGELIGSCHIHEGTGMYRTWHPNGQLMSETSMIDGKNTGRSVAYFEDGELAGETYWLENEKVSKKRYLEACNLNPDLPCHAVQKTRRLARSANQVVPNPSTRSLITTDELPLKLLQGAREVLSWLEESRQPSRSLGEATDQDDSIRLAKELYDRGAVAVHAVEIQGEQDDDQNSGRLVVELPDDKRRRKKLFRLCGDLASETGFEPDPDVGQRFLLLMLD